MPATQQIKQQPKKRNLIIITSALCVLAVVVLVAAIFVAMQANTLSCAQSTVPVKLSDGAKTTYNVKGWLCSKGSLAGKTVQLLVSGVSYDHNYWDFPYQPDTYSYVRSATNAGFAVFNFDRLGVGESDKPPAADLTVPAEAYVAHQLIQDLRQGSIGGTAFNKVVGVGHSMGASIMIVEGGTYNDTNGLILADSLHQANTAQQAKLTSERYPASQDPKFKNANLPAGYLTTKPGTRGGGFYAAQYADPNVIAKDEDLKQTVTTGEISTLSAGRDPKNSKAITTPVLLVVGDTDSINCNESIGLSCKDSATVLNREHDNYSDKTCLEAFVLSKSGHDTNLHRTAQDWFNEATSWIQRRVGNGDTKPTNACQA